MLGTERDPKVHDRRKLRGAFKARSPALHDMFHNFNIFFVCQGSVDTVVTLIMADRQQVPEDPGASRLVLQWLPAGVHDHGGEAVLVIRSGCEEAVGDPEVPEVPTSEAPTPCCPSTRRHTPPPTLCGSSPPFSSL